MRFAVYIIFTLFISSCKQSKVEIPKASEVLSPTDHPAFVETLEDAHNKTEFYNKETVCFNLDMTFGARKSKYKIFTTPSSSKIKVEKEDGTTTVMKDGKIYTNADSTKWGSEKFGIYTYQYFFMVPFKMSDEGTIWKKLPQATIAGKTTNSAMLTFESGTGDAPDDWYIVHSDPKTNLINYVGYIVTGGGSTVEEAEKNAHAIRYFDYNNIDGVPIASSWEFYDYTKNKSIGEQIGHGNLRNVMFMDILEDTYDTEDLTLIN